jgi:hypothetical protein
MYRPVAPIVSLFVAPAVVTITFLLTPFARARRIVPWLIAPLVYVVVAFVAVFISVNLGLIEP